MTEFDADTRAWSYLPAVREFRDAVVERDLDLVQACFALTDPRTLAVLAAELWHEAEGDAQGLREELSEERERMARLREELAAERKRCREVEDENIGLLADLHKLLGPGGMKAVKQITEERDLYKKKVAELRAEMDQAAERNKAKRAA